MLLDDVDRLVAEAERATAAQEWGKADEAYEAALAMLPGDGNTTVRRRLRVEWAKVQMENRQLPTAHQELKQLLDEMVHAESADPPELLADVRSTLDTSTARSPPPSAAVARRRTC